MKLLSLAPALVLLSSAPNVYAWGTVSAPTKPPMQFPALGFLSAESENDIRQVRGMPLTLQQLGHETVAYIATNFVASETESFFQNILHNDTTSYLAGVATWADSFRYTAAGRFSAPFHFIDAEDSPPSTCGVTFSRDCPEEGCVISAIQNYVNCPSICVRVTRLTNSRRVKF